MKKVGKILAHGESNHCHQLKKTNNVVELDDGTREFEVAEPDTLVHEEHKPIELQPNKYVSDRVREQDHFAEEARRVQD